MKEKMQKRKLFDANCRRIGARQVLVLGLLWLAGTIAVQAQFTNWVAFNDHTPGSTPPEWATHPNVTSYNMRGVPAGNAGTELSGNLKDFNSGEFVNAVITSSKGGPRDPDDFGSSGYPNPGTPSYELFFGKVNLGNSQSMIGVRAEPANNHSSQRLTFSGLDPSKRYVFKGTATRTGDNNYPRRWTKATIEGVISFTEDHSAGVSTAANFPSGGLTAEQAGLHTGDNRPGDVVGWKEIDPGPDGTFSVLAEQWTANPLPNGQTPDLTVYGYGFNGIMLAEVETGPATPITITSHPANVTAPERGTATFEVAADGSPRTFYWFRKGAGELNFSHVPNANGPAYTVSPLAFPTDNGVQVFAVVSNLFGAQTSSVANLTVIQDTTPPTVVSAVGQVNPHQVLVTFSEDIDVNLVDLGNFIVFRRGTDPGLTSLGTASATLVGGNRVLVETINPRDTSAQANYDVQIWDQRDASSGNNEIDPNPLIVPVRVSVVLIGFDEGTDNIWKYFVSNSIDLWSTSPNWMNVGFDDSAWPEGPAGLGLDSSANGVPIRTMIPYTAQSEPAFFRRTFLLPSDPADVTLTMRHVFEDGAVVYINGQEVARVRANPGPYTFASRATTTAPDPTPIEGPVTLPTSSLVAGDNTIAVLVLQSGATSSDVEMALELVASFTTFTSGAPEITTPLVNQTVDESGSVTFEVSVTGAVPRQFEWYKGTDLIPGATSRSYTISRVSLADAGTYRVVVRNADGEAESSATLTVVADEVGPVFVSAVADPSLTNIMLTVYDRSGLVNVGESSNYAVNRVGGGGDLSVLSATLISPSNIVLHTTPREQGQNYQVTLFDVTDASAAANPVSPDTIRMISEIVVLRPDETTLWRFDSSSNSLDEVAWQLPGFDDSAWGAGLAGFTTPTPEIVPEGYELRTTNMVAVNAGGPPVTYFRVHFNMPGSVAGATMRIAGVIDDGLVAYINGVEAGRIRMPTNTPISFTNFATAASPEATELHSLSHVVLTNLSGLVSGENTLAIQLHQNNMTSSDAVLSIELIAGVLEFGDEPPSCPPLRISRNEAGQVTISWTGGDGCVLQETTALDGPATVWTASARQNGVPFTPPAGPGARFYRLCSGNCN